MKAAPLQLIGHADPTTLGAKKSSRSELRTGYSICIVARELAYLFKNGGIGTCNWLLANLLANDGWRVHILYCGSNDYQEAAYDKVKQHFESIGCSISRLDDCVTLDAFNVAACHRTWFLDLSDKVRHALEELNRTHEFDLIEFADYQGAGFRSIQAKKAGIAFENTEMIVKLHSPSQWVREANLRWMDNADDLLIDYFERYSFENADYQIAPARYMLDYARQVGWQIKDSAQVVRYAYPQPDGLACVTKVPDEIVFFGRLETRKGLEVFVDAVSKLDAKVQVTFLGKDTNLWNGVSALKWIKRKLGHRRVVCLTEFNHSEAIKYLKSGNRLAVMPSLTDNLPNTVSECVVNGIPFLAAEVGGIPEMLPDSDLRKKVLFVPNPADLHRCLNDYLALPTEQLQSLQKKIFDLVQVSAHNENVSLRYGAIAQSARSVKEKNLERSSSSAVSEAEPLVTVCVTYFNLAEFLPETLASLARQTYANLEVLVINDGSTDPEAIKVFQEQERHYPQFHFRSCSNAGLGAARNRGLEEAHGELFLPVDADNVARPEMVEKFVKSIQHNPECSALACYYLAFTSSDNLKRGKFMYAYRPSGGPHALGSLQNVYGDANGIFRTADLRAVGGYETDMGTTCEDWEVFVKLVNAGFNLDVIPEHLFYYRYRKDSMFRSTNSYLNQNRVLRQFFRLEKFSEADRIGLWTMLVSLQKRDQEHFYSHWINSRRCSCCGATSPWYLAFVEKFAAPVVRLIELLKARRS